ncbi:MAG TPA: NusG domain II-containing protein [Mariprofundaceae bacterium]|nr:NusG domain II-containing protein [Mariprofundaceae bacterium]
MPSLATAAPARQDLRRLLSGTRIDRLLLIAGLACIAALWLWLQREVPAGPPMVLIYHGKHLIAEYPIPSEGAPIHVQAKGDIGVSDIVIDTHGVHFESSPCIGKQCILAGTKHHPGDIIACVPNRILVSIRGSGARDDGYDGIVQ